MLNYTYAAFIKGMDAEKRREFDMQLMPEPSRIDELLPEALRGMTPPPGWRAVKDPWS